MIRAMDGGWSDAEMPVLRYFVFVGAALLALIFVMGEAFPSPPAPEVASAANNATDVSAIRIHTDRKWPERVVFDTNAKTIFPAPTQTADNAAAIPGRAADSSTKLTARDAFAQLTPSDLKKPDPKLPQKRRIAKRRAPPPAMQVAQRPQPGLFANNIW